MAELSGGIRFIKGIGEQRAKLLARLGIRTLRDLTSYFPRDYQDRTIIKKVPDVKDGESVCISALVLNAPRASRIRKGMELLKFRAVPTIPEPLISPTSTAPILKTNSKSARNMCFSANSPANRAVCRNL